MMNVETYFAVQTVVSGFSVAESPNVSRPFDPIAENCWIIQHALQTLYQVAAIRREALIPALPVQSFRRVTCSILLFCSATRVYSIYRNCHASPDQKYFLFVFTCNLQHAILRLLTIDILHSKKG